MERAGQRMIPRPTTLCNESVYVCEVTQWLPLLVVELLLQIGCTA